MKRAALILAATAGLGLGCMIPVPSELIDARTAYDRARSSQTRTLAPGELARAKQALERAEYEYQQYPSSQSARDLAYVAQRRVLIAESRARLELARRDKAQAQEQLAQRHATSEEELLKARAQLQAREDELRRQQEAQQRMQAEQSAREQQSQKEQLAQAQQQLEQQRQELKTRQQELEEARQRQAQAEASQRAALEQVEKFAKVEQEKRGTVITLPGGLLFPPGRTDLTPDAQRALEKVAEALKELPEQQRLVIEGHSDARGPEETNRELSVLRANAVKDFLGSHGVQRDRIEAVGFGETRPIASNESSEGRATNRRVEIVVQRGVGGSGAPQGR